MPDFKSGADAVFVRSEILGSESEIVSGFDFNNGVDYSKLIASYKFMGFQATNLASAIEEINKMRNWRLSDEPIHEDDDEATKDPDVC